MPEQEREELSIPENGVFISWEMPEFPVHDRSRRWYFISGTLAFALVLYGIFSGNFLFSVIIIMGALVMFLTSQRKPEQVSVALTTTGIAVGSAFHPYHEFADFAILYQPPEVKQLYLRPKKGMRTALSIPLENTDPNVIRESLLLFVPEDLDKTEESLTEMLLRVYKL